MSHRNCHAHRALVGAVAVLLCATASQAQERGVYGELRGGAVFVTDADATNLGGLNGTMSNDTGFLLEGAVGYSYGNGVRAEFALGYRQNDLDEFEVPPVAPVSADGDFSAFTVMGNVYYDFDLDGTGGIGSGVTPFVGAGIGAAFVETEVRAFGGVPLSAEDQDDTAFAWQIIAGLAYEISPDVTATVSYSYFATPDIDFDGVGYEYASHNILAGISMDF